MLLPLACATNFKPALIHYPLQQILYHRAYLYIVCCPLVYQVGIPLAPVKVNDACLAQSK